jgi:hypothetical protein
LTTEEAAPSRPEFEVPERQTVALQDDTGFTIFLYDAEVPHEGAKCRLTLPFR